MRSRRCYIAASVDFVRSHYKVIVGPDVGIEHVVLVVAVVVVAAAVVVVVAVVVAVVVVEVFAFVPAATFVVVVVVHLVDVVVFAVVVLMLLSVVAVARLAAVVLVFAPLSPGYPNPLFGTYMLYFLKHCPPQVKTCFGCGQTLKSGGQIGEPPYDLVIVSNAKRSYYDRAGQLQERPGNVYYHVNAGCMKTPSIFHGIPGANTICDQRYDNTSSLSLCQRIWTRNIKSLTQRKIFDI